MDGLSPSRQGHRAAHGAVGRHGPHQVVRVRGAGGQPDLHVPGAAALRQPVAGEFAGVAAAAPAADAGRRGAAAARRHRSRHHRRRRPPSRRRSRRRRRPRSTRSIRSSRATTARSVACARSSWADGARRCLASRAACCGTSAVGPLAPPSAWRSTLRDEDNTSLFAEVEANYVTANKAYIGTGLGIWDFTDGDTVAPTALHQLRRADLEELDDGGAPLPDRRDAAVPRRSRRDRQQLHVLGRPAVSVALERSGPYVGPNFSSGTFGPTCARTEVRAYVRTLAVLCDPFGDGPEDTLQMARASPVDHLVSPEEGHTAVGLVIEHVGVGARL